MTTQNRIMKQYGGCYLVFDQGVARIRTAAKTEVVPETWLRSEYSIVSPGTELWQLSQSRALKDLRPAGYMTIGQSKSGEFLLAPAPHGATFSENIDGVLKARVSIELMAVARFQLITAVTMSKDKMIFQDRNAVVVVGSGPVAIGAVLELLRLSFSKITIVTSRKAFVTNHFKEFSEVEVEGPDRSTFGKYVIECTGRSERITTCISRLEEGGILGLIGSPRGFSELDLYTIHRKGINLVGMHELIAFEPKKRQRLFEEILLWLDDVEIVKHRGCFRYWPNGSFGELFRALETERPQEPFQILDWWMAE